MGTTVAPAHSAPRSASAHSARVLARIATRSPALDAEGGEPAGDLVRGATHVRIREGVGVAGIRRAHRHTGVRGDGRPEHRKQGLGEPACGVGRGNGLLCGHVYTGVGSMRGGAGGRLGVTGAGISGHGGGARVGHQARRPSSSMAAGRTTGRTSRASSRTTVTTATPNWRTLNRSVNRNGRVAATITAAVPVTAAAVWRRPWRAAARGLSPASTCSRIRASRNTS